jgi:dGTPase
MYTLDNFPPANIAAHLQASDKRASRLHDNTQHHYRSNYQRDRDRILYTPSFRRLIGKTQIFNVGIGEHYRNRLTHTLEVMQIATTISKYLGLNTELTEAIALGHDIGHAPFGHVGERTLNFFMNNCGILDKYGVVIQDGHRGFKHNLQALRILLYIEKKSRDFAGIDITTDTLWGIVNHTDVKWKECEKFDKDNCSCLMKRGHKRESSGKDFTCLNMQEDLNPKEEKYALTSVDFYEKYIQELLEDSWTFEAYIVKQADEIAQRYHDVEDGILLGIFEPQRIIDEFDKYFKVHAQEQDYIGKLNKIKKEKERDYLLPVLTRFVVDFYITNYILNVANNLEQIIDKYSIKDNEDFYLKKSHIWEGEKDEIENKMSFSAGFEKFNKKIKLLLKNRIINSRKAQMMDGKGTFIIRKLIEAYMNTPNQLPDNVITKLFIEFKEIIDNLRDEDKSALLKKNSFLKRLLKKMTREKEMTKEIIGNLRDELDKPALLKINSFLLCLYRSICDYISSMSDRHALKQYEKLYGSGVLS